MGRIATYEGIAALATAGSDLLHDTSIDLAIIHGLHDEATAVSEAINHLPDSLDLSLDEPRTAQALTDTIPEFQALDLVANEWWRTQPLNNGYSFIPKISSAWVRKHGIPAHFDVLSEDMPIDGPLTLSLRLDEDINNLRRFYAKRYPDIMTLATPAAEAVTRTLEKQMRIVNITRKANLAGMSNVLQDPGDLIMFMNHPEPTLHAVTTERTVSLIASYCLNAIIP